MAHKKHENKKQPTKQTNQVNQQADSTQVQQRLEQYHQIAQALHSSLTPAQAETALLPLTETSEATQLAFLKVLVKESTPDAADVLQGVNAFAPLKEVRKAAKRALIQLEGSRLYPRWLPPIEVPAQGRAEVEIEIDPNVPMNFWRGMMTDSLDTGQAHLMLLFEQGQHGQEVRMMGFLLDFGYDGIKDFFTRVISKRQAEQQISQMRSHLVDIDLIDCTLEKGASLIEAALEANRQAQTQPHPDYTRNLPLIQDLILEPNDIIDPDIDDEIEDDYYPPFSPLLEKLLSVSDVGEQAAALLDEWTDGNYGAVYDQLSSDSPLRDGLTRDEWIDQRTRWQAEAQPANIHSTFVHERESDSEEDPIVVDIGWSLELNDTPPNLRPKELPTATAIYPETRRHWFWSSYTLVEEGDELRLYTIVDEGEKALHLPLTGLRENLEDAIKLTAEQLERLREKAEEEPEENHAPDGVITLLNINNNADSMDQNLAFGEMASSLHEVLHITTVAMHYADALITLAPLESPEIYDTAFDQAEMLQDHERAASYMQLLADRFPASRAEALKKLAIAQFGIGEDYGEKDDEQSEERFLNLAEQNLRDSLATEKTAFACILLAQTLISQDKQLDEAQDLLRQAQTMETQPREETLIETSLARLAENEHNLEQALEHYQRAVAISPDFPGVWHSIGQLQFQLKQFDASEQSLLRSIEEEPELAEAYIILATIYLENQNDPVKAQNLLEEGLEENEDSAELLAALAILHLRNGDLDNAHMYLMYAEEIAPELEMVQMLRQTYDAQRAAQRKPSKQKSKSQKQKKKK